MTEIKGGCRSIQIAGGYPNCLEWPEAMQLIPKGAKIPEDWYGI